MATAILSLHRGAKTVTEEELTAYKAPEPEGRWYPLSHSRVLTVVKQTLDEAGFSVGRQQLGVMRDGSRFFGTLDLKTPISEGVALTVGVRNSVDKSFPLGFCAGSRVFVCDNLAFSAELLVKRKHTIFGERDFIRRIAEAVASLNGFREQEAEKIDRLKGFELSPELAEALMLRAYERGIVGARDLPRVIRLWREPLHDEFRVSTAWSLLNTFTDAMRERSVKQPQDFAVSTMRLGALLDPERN